MTKKLIKNKSVIEDNWLTVNTANNTSSEKENIILPLDYCLQHIDEIKNTAQKQKIGVALSTESDINTLAPLLDHLTLICISFPQFTDGRGFSLARALRNKHNYQSELRACGNIIVDQLHYLKRCGFDAYELKEEININTALAALDDFSIHYQSAADDVLPIYQQR